MQLRQRSLKENKTGTNLKQVTKLCWFIPIVSEYGDEIKIVVIDISINWHNPKTSHEGGLSLKQNKNNNGTPLFKEVEA